MKTPDYSRSSLSVIASILDFYGLKSNYPVLPELSGKLKDAPTKNIIYILLDGLGENLIRRHLPANSFFNRNDAAAVSAVFPSTTTAATTSIGTGLSPNEHGWIGWSLYFKELGRQIDAFMDRDGFSHERYPYCSAAQTYMPYETIYSLLKGRVETHTLNPFQTYAAEGADVKHVYSGLSDCLRLTASIANDPGSKFISVYINEPDHTMHETGVASEKTIGVFTSLNEKMEAFCKTLPKDTLVIITADHGLVDVDETVNIDEIPEIADCLWMPPSIEARAASFFVKPHKKADFEKAFLERFQKDFVLFTHEEVFEKQLLGLGKTHRKTDDFIGDYLACATGSRSLRFSTPASKPFTLIGQHAGLTEDEMTVPVILSRT